MAKTNAAGPSASYFNTSSVSGIDSVAGNSQQENRDRFSETYQKQRDGFIRDLKQFHEAKGTPINTLPSISGYEIDLYLLYSLVTERGGWLKVSSKQLWDPVLKELDFPHQCTNITVAIKQIYYRYLDKYEKCHYLCEDIDQNNDDDESRVRRINVRSVHAVPMTYNYHQHNLTDTVREQNNLCETLYSPTDYDRLLLSLICPLPNEQDFAINVCNLISNEGRYTLKLAKCPLLVDFLLAHAGLYKDDSLKVLFNDIYGQVRPHSLKNFWSDVLENLEYFDLADGNDSLQHSADLGSDDEYEENNNVSGSFNGNIPNGECVSKEFRNDLKVFLAKNKNDIIKIKQSSQYGFQNGAQSVNFELDESDKMLFCLGRSLGTQEYIGQRVQQITNIIRNLSFFDSNHEILAGNELVIRFILLCINSKWNTLHQNAFDILGNIASVINLRKFKKRLVQSIFQIIKRGLYNTDRTYIIASLEILRKFCDIETNVPLVIRSLSDSDYEVIVSFLTVHDIMLIIYTLECLYTLTSQGEKPCAAISKIYFILYILVDLVTVEAKSYGTKACIGMKLLETVTAVPVTTNTNIGNVSSSLTSTANYMSSANNNVNAATITMTSGNSTSTLVQLSSIPVSSTIPNTITVANHNANNTNPSLIVVSSAGVMVSNIGQSLPKFTSTTIKTPVQVRSNTGNVATVLGTLPLNTVTILKNPTGNSVLTQTHTSGSNIPMLSNQSAVVTTTISTTTTVPQSSTITDICHQQLMQENEQFATIWLQANFEQTNLSMHTVETQELYKNYLTSCAKYGRRGFIAPAHFPKFVRNLFGNNVGPYKGKTIPKTDALFYEGIKLRSAPLQMQFQTGSSQQTVPTSIALISTSTTTQQSQVLAHPHLSQALLGVSALSPVTTVTLTTTSAVGTISTVNIPQVSGHRNDLSENSIGGSSFHQNNSSLIKSLLATKVNECMKIATVIPDLQHVQVVQRQQQQQQKLVVTSTGLSNSVIINNNNTNKIINVNPSKNVVDTKLLNRSRLNGARALLADNVECPTPPPLAPLSQSKPLMMTVVTSTSNNNNGLICASSTFNSCDNSSSSITVDDVTEENSLTSFEGIFNGGAPNTIDIDGPQQQQINTSNVGCLGKTLKLADLLEKKVDNKEPPILNGATIGKELRIGEKGLELVENNDSNSNSEKRSLNDDESNENIMVKKQRLAHDDDDEDFQNDDEEEDDDEADDDNVNDNHNDNDDDADGDSEVNVKASATAANLYAALAASALEDEDVDEMMNDVPQKPLQSTTIALQQPAQLPFPVPLVATSEPQMTTIEPQIIQKPQITLNKATVAATQSIPLIVQTSNTSNQRSAPLVIAQANTGQLLMTPGGQAHVQLVPSSTQPGQFVLSGGQSQTVLLAQTTGQSGSAPKTIIILQPQNAGTGNSSTQKVLFAPHSHQNVVVANLPTKSIVQTSQSLQIAQISQSPSPQQQLFTSQSPSTVVAVPSSVVVTKTTSTVTNINSNSGSNMHNIAETSYFSDTSANKLSNNNNNNNNNANSSPVTKTQSLPLTSSSYQIATTSTFQQASSQSQQQPQHPQPATVPQIPRSIIDYNLIFVCEWLGCSKPQKYKSANEVYNHACAAHCPNDDEEPVQCLWDRCDLLKRPRYSLMTHLWDKHCTPEAIKQSMERRKKIALSGGANEAVESLPSSFHPGYAPDAALHAIKRHALDFTNAKELQKSTKSNFNPDTSSNQSSTSNDQEENEGPVTKSIRLTSCLILRNLVIYNKWFKHNVESARTMAYILFELSDRKDNMFS